MISNYKKVCTKTVAGNDSKFFATPVNDIASLTMTADEVSALTMEATKLFAELNADLDGVQFTSNGVSRKGYVNNQELIATFTQKSKALEATVNELSDAVVCGLVIIRVDGNRRAWISGISDVTKEGKSRPWNELEDGFDSGGSIENSEEGNMYTLTFRRMSKVKELPLDATLTAAILAGTSPLIDWEA